MMTYREMLPNDELPSDNTKLSPETELYDFFVNLLPNSLAQHEDLATVRDTLKRLGEILDGTTSIHVIGYLLHKVGGHYWRSPASSALHPGIYDGGLIPRELMEAIPKDIAQSVQQNGLPILMNGGEYIQLAENGVDYVHREGGFTLVGAKSGTIHSIYLPVAGSFLFPTIYRKNVGESFAGPFEIVGTDKTTIDSLKGLSAMVIMAQASACFNKLGTHAEQINYITSMLPVIEKQVRWV